MTPALEALAQVFRDIRAGTVTVEPVESAFGLPSWKTSNGWRITAFDDCGFWDYIHAATAPDGTELNYTSIYGWSESEPPTGWDMVEEEVEPDSEEVQRIWRHPRWWRIYPEKP